MENEPLRAQGVFRDQENERFLCFGFNRRPSDEELRAVHDLLRRPLPPEEQEGKDEA